MMTSQWSAQPYAPIVALAYSPDGTKVISASVGPDKAIRVWSASGL